MRGLLGGRFVMLRRCVLLTALGLLSGCAADLGSTSHELRIFHAERHTVESNFRIETSIDCFAGPF